MKVALLSKLAIIILSAQPGLDGKCLGLLVELHPPKSSPS